MRAALAGSAGMGPFFILNVGGDGRGWRPAATAYSGGLRGPIDGTARQLGVTEARVAASTVQLGYAARLWSPVLYCALIAGLVPDLRQLRVDVGPPVRLNVPEPRGWQAQAPDLAALAYRMVVTEHLEPMGDGLPVKIAAGLLWGNAASAMTAALRVLVAVRPGQAGAARGMAETLLGMGALRGTGELTGPGLEFRRRSCCLYYRVPGGGLCGDCPLPSEPR
ncbi:MAG TPA: (2Fe-2S)-binding protein [Streptosporangiaceae bacterium]